MIEIIYTPPRESTTGYPGYIRIPKMIWAFEKVTDVWSLKNMAIFGMLIFWGVK